MSARVEFLLQDPQNELLVSYASLQELLNKVGRGKLRLTTGSVSEVFARVQDLRVRFLPFSIEEIIAAANLEHRHSDPFDRMLIAQVQAQSIPLVTIDADIRGYPIQTIWD